MADAAIPPKEDKGLLYKLTNPKETFSGWGKDLWGSVVTGATELGAAFGGGAANKGAEVVETKVKEVGAGLGLTGGTQPTTPAPTTVVAPESAGQAKPQGTPAPAAGAPATSVKPAENPYSFQGLLQGLKKILPSGLASAIGMGDGDSAAEGSGRNERDGKSQGMFGKVLGFLGDILSGGLNLILTAIVAVLAIGVALVKGAGSWISGALGIGDKAAPSRSDASRVVAKADERKPSKPEALKPETPAVAQAAATPAAKAATQGLEQSVSAAEEPTRRPSVEETVAALREAASGGRNVDGVPSSSSGTPNQTTLLGSARVAHAPGGG